MKNFHFSLLRYKKGQTWFNLLCNAVIFLHSAGVSYFIRRALNQFEMSQGQTLKMVYPFLIGILWVAALRIVAILTCAVLDAVRGFYYQNRARLNLMKQLFARSDVTEVSGDANSIFEVLDDDVPAATFPMELLTEVSGYAVYALTAVIMLFRIHWQVTLFIFLPLSLALYGVQRLSEQMKERRKVNRAAHDRVSVLIGDLADAAVTIQALGAEEAVLDEYVRVNAARRDAVVRDATYNEQINFLLQGSVGLGTAVMMLIGARLMGNGQFGMGDFSFFVAHLFTLSDLVYRLVELFYESKKAEVSYERMLKLLQGAKPEVLAEDVDIAPLHKDYPVLPAPQAKPWQEYVVKGLGYRYAEGGGVQGVNLHLRPGELAVVRGEMASGKSTLMNVLMGLMPAQEGSAELVGDGAVAMGLPQRSGLFKGDLLQNVMLGQQLEEARVREALQVAALEDTVNAWPEGWQSEVGGRGEQLSGGQRQRLMLARLLARDAAVYVVDDSISALDEAIQVQVASRLKTFLQQKQSAAVVATNADSMLPFADHIYHLGDSPLSGK